VSSERVLVLLFVSFRNLAIERVTWRTSELSFALEQKRDQLISMEWVLSQKENPLRYFNLYCHGERGYGNMRNYSHTKTTCIQIPCFVSSDQ